MIHSTPENNDLPPRPVWQSLARGFKCRCPNCGEGKIFGKFLKVQPECTICGQAFEGHRADDLPPYITITIVGHIIVGLILMVERETNWPIWVHMTLWPLLTTVMTLLLMQRVKGAIIGYQWALRLHGFDPIGDVHDMAINQSGRANITSKSSI